ncbi:hypothetical protein Tco_1324031, partial [Tanacetum coccineum]
MYRILNDSFREGYRPSYKREHTKANNDLANAIFPFLFEVIADPSASVEALLSKKPKFLRRPTSTKTHAPAPSAPSQKATPSNALSLKPMPANNASYSASSLVVLNLNLRAYVHSFPSGLTSIRPVPEPSKLEAPSVYSFHVLSNFSSLFAASGFLVSVSLSSMEGVSARKYASIYPLTELRPLNAMSCSPSSMAHLAIHLDFSGLARIGLMGLSVNTLMGTTIILSVEATRYITNTSPLIGVLLRALKNGSDLSTPFKRNRLRDVSFPLRLYISLSVLGSFRLVIALTFEGLALIPCLVMRGTLDHYVVNIGFKVLLNLIIKYLVDQSLASKKHFCQDPERDSTFQSISSKGLQSLGQALFMYVKSTHILQPPSLFFTMTGLATLNVPAFVSASTSLQAALCHSGANPHFFCLTGSVFLYSFSLCSVLKGFPPTI